jgi:putative hydrolase of the HAD superfamily
VLFLFDLDDTLVDHTGASTAAITGWIRDAGFPSHVDGLESSQVWWDIDDDVFPDYLAGRLSYDQQRRLRVSRFLLSMGVVTDDLNESDLDRHFNEYRSRYEAAWAPFPDAVETLTALASTNRVAVLTNGDQVRQEHKMRSTGLLPLVEDVFASSTLPAAKPDPAAFLSVLDRLGVEPADACYIGDRLDVDAEAAKAAGLTGIWLNRRGRRLSTGDIPTISSLAELVAR